MVTLYQLYWPKGVNCHWCTSWSEVLRYKNEGHEYSGVFGYICAEEEPGTLPLYRMYWSKGGIHIILLHGLKYVNSKMKVMNTKV